MIKLVSSVYKSVTSLTDLLAMATSFGSAEAKRYISETSAVHAELRQAIDLRKVETILSRMTDIQDMDIPEEAKTLATAKLQQLLEAELTKASA